MNWKYILPGIIALGIAMVVNKPTPKMVHKPPESRAALKVVTSFSILADLVQSIGRDHVTVETIVGPDADAHVYRPTPLNAQILAGADLVIINGLGFEGWIERLIATSGYKGEVVIASMGVQAKKMHDQKGHIVQDPHTWHSVPNVMIYVKNIAQALIKADMKNKSFYEEHSQYYIAQLSVLDLWIRQKIEKIPQHKRKIITAHDAFQYLGHEYNIEFLSPVGVSTQEEPSAKTTASLIQQIKTQNIYAIFSENAAQTKLIDTITKETNRLISGVLYADALSKDNGPAATYIAMARHNIETLCSGMERD